MDTNQWLASCDSLGVLAVLAYTRFGWITAQWQKQLLVMTAKTYPSSSIMLNSSPFGLNILLPNWWACMNNFKYWWCQSCCVWRTQKVWLIVGGGRGGWNLMQISRWIYEYETRFVAVLYKKNLLLWKVDRRWLEVKQFGLILRSDMCLARALQSTT